MSELSRKMFRAETEAVRQHLAEQEQQTTDKAAGALRPATNTWTIEGCYDSDNDKWHGLGGTYSDHDEALDAFKRRAESDSDHVKHFKFRLVRATTAYTVEDEIEPAAEVQP
ncbi:hypothetical protein ACFW08_20130 [Streptomyces sp. NPDC058960]|uniref:hypothetical protein n=1 Tax=Streptomyces sp. NPDC058960 TaxID=3346679 RepID=UPI003685D65C